MMLKEQASTVADETGKTPMKLISEIVAAQAELTQWRLDIHAHSDLAFEESRTADFVASTKEVTRFASCPEKNLISRRQGQRPCQPVVLPITSAADPYNR